MRTIFSLFLLFSTPALATNVPIQKEFRDWMVTCDNLRSCVAEGVDEDNPSLVVRFSREAGPHGAASLAVYGMAGDTDAVRLQLDKRPLRLTKKDWYSDGTDEDLSFETDSQGEIHTLIDALRNGHRLASGDASASLDGLSAALLLIDDMQGRIDTDSAWIRRGQKLPDAVPAAPLAPNAIAHPYRGPALTKSQREAVIAAAVSTSMKDDSNGDCDMESSEKPETQAERLSERDALVLVECYRAAYQSGSRAFRVQIGRPAKIQMIALPSIPGREAEKILTFAEYDAATGTLSHHVKGRGIGDCGETAEWLFDGNDFVLSSMTSETKCIGILLDFPVLWRNR
jgi:hypothetical protein